MIVQVPGINGLNKTTGCEKASKVICNFLNLDSKKILLENANLENQESEIYQKSKQIFHNSKKTIFLGGDHSISYPLSKAFVKTHNSPAIIVFDAHFDLMQPLKNPTHEEWLRALIEEKPLIEILLVGIRKNSKNIDEQEIEFAKKNNLKIIYSDEFENSKNKILSFAKNKQLYVSLDLDVLDKSLFDATGYPEEKGLSLNQLKEILEKLNKNIISLDLVEYNPNLDKNNSNLNLIAKILKPLIQ